LVGEVVIGRRLRKRGKGRNDRRDRPGEQGDQQQARPAGINRHGGAAKWNGSWIRIREKMSALTSGVPQQDLS
jgi:hypothetical protein